MTYPLTRCVENTVEVGALIHLDLSQLCAWLSSRTQSCPRPEACAARWCAKAGRRSLRNVFPLEAPRHQIYVPFTVGRDLFASFKLLSRSESTGLRRPELVCGCSMPAHRRQDSRLRKPVRGEVHLHPSVNKRCKLSPIKRCNSRCTVLCWMPPFVSRTRR
jgi:hypothetical protein